MALISEGDGSIGQTPQNHYFMVEVVRWNGTQHQKRFFFERVLNGERFGNALSERKTKTVVLDAEILDAGRFLSIAVILIRVTDYHSFAEQTLM